ncbi:MAG TPA: DUF779 domain-containing protein [Mycobacteriales bacterium]|nr:DUF779 domain-containing protein [Mycobacteriales bacterium]
MTSIPRRVLVTERAADLIRRLRGEHGPLMFHQSGGCCDGSSPMCYPAGEFLVGDRDVLLGSVLPEEGGTPVWISGTQFAAWRHTQLVLDVVPGRGGGFSLEAPHGVRFLTRGRVYSPDELTALDTAPPLTGAQVEAGEVEPPGGGPTIISADDLLAICPAPTRP